MNRLEKGGKEFSEKRFGGFHMNSNLSKKNIYFKVHLNKWIQNAKQAEHKKLNIFQNIFAINDPSN